MTTNAAYRATHFSRSVDASGTFVDEPVTRQYLSLQTDVIGPVFSKIWDTPDSDFSDRMKHVIEPIFSTDVARLRSEILRQADAVVMLTDHSDFDLDLGVYHFPDVPIPSGETPASLLARRCYEGARRRYPSVTKEIDDRLQHELNMIFRMGWPAYFLMVADIVEHTRNVMGIRCSCRGSAAGSLVVYVLGISDVDPVRYDLLFERFMNERREEIPDIDVDVESHRREDVLSYILDTYGAEQTAICCMVDTFRARMAIREVGKALGMPPEEMGKLVKSEIAKWAKVIKAAGIRLD